MAMYSDTRDFEGAKFVRTSFKGATLRSCDVSGVLVEAALNRQFPGRELQKAQTPEGLLRMEQPFHEIGQIFTGAAEMGFDLSIFRDDAPTFTRPFLIFDVPREGAGAVSRQ